MLLFWSQTAQHQILLCPAWRGDTGRNSLVFPREGDLSGGGRGEEEDRWRRRRSKAFKALSACLPLYIFNWPKKKRRKNGKKKKREWDGDMDQLLRTPSCTTARNSARPRVRIRVHMCQKGRKWEAVLVSGCFFVAWASYFKLIRVKYFTQQCSSNFVATVWCLIQHLWDNLRAITDSFWSKWEQIPAARPLNVAESLHRRVKADTAAADLWT